MKGIIKSYLDEKKYGFIKADDGEQYFFHYNDLSSNSKSKEISKNLSVTFEPALNKKGHYAKNIQIQETFTKNVLVPYFENQNSEPKYGRVIKRKPIQTEFIKDINEARSQLACLAASAGANAILNKRLVKETFNQGNYRYTVHSFKADLCLVVETVVCESKEESNTSKKEIELKKSQFDSHHLRVKSAMDNQIEKQIKDQNNAKVAPLVFILFIFIFIFLSFIIN